jgi:hypothetical protein
MAMLMLVPCDPLRPRRADEHFVPEANAAKDLGIEVAVVDHDILAGSGDPARAVAGVPESADAVYRGWMLRCEQYQAFETALAARGVRGLGETRMKFWCKINT